ncbi:unnamed protein product, partial [Allacma fusca]
MLEGKILSVLLVIRNPQNLPVTIQPRCLRRIRALDTRLFFFKNSLNGSNVLKPRAVNFDYRQIWNQSLVPMPPSLFVLDV